VRVLARVFLDRRGDTPIGVAFAQHRIHGAAQHARVSRLDRFLGVVLRVFRVVGNGVPLRLQLVDRRLELRHRGADVRQLDDVGLGRLRQLAQLRQVVRLPPIRRKQVGEAGQDSAGQRNVARLDDHVRGPRERLDDREQ
jgi:hypothetical protein